MSPMRIVVAPDKFSGSLTAAEAASAIAAGIVEAVAASEVVERPVADGGDGTLDALAAAGWTQRPVDVTGPLGEPTRARIAWQGTTAVVELADCCGRLRLPRGRAAPTTAGTRGAGAAILAAAEDGAETVVVGLGGSASTDGGLGLLSALGVRVLDQDGAPVTAPLGLARAARIDVSQLADPLHGLPIVLAADVRAPLLGPDGAARLFGPQKGAAPGQVDALETALTRWAHVLRQHCGEPVADVPGAGAAGGTVAGVLGALGGICDVEIRSGADVVIDAVGLADDLAEADAVVIGEGSLDAQSLLGKAPIVVARLAGELECQVAAVIGRLDLDSTLLRRAGVEHAVELRELARVGEDPMRDAARLARRAGALLANRLGA